MNKGRRGSEETAQANSRKSESLYFKCIFNIKKLEHEFETFEIN